MGFAGEVCRDFPRVSQTASGEMRGLLADCSSNEFRPPRLDRHHN